MVLDVPADGVRRCGVVFQDKDGMRYTTQAFICRKSDLVDYFLLISSNALLFLLPAETEIHLVLKSDAKTHSPMVFIILEG